LIYVKFTSSRLRQTDAGSPPIEVSWRPAMILQPYSWIPLPPFVRGADRDTARDVRSGLSPFQQWIHAIGGCACRWTSGVCDCWNPKREAMTAEKASSHEK